MVTRSVRTYVLLAVLVALAVLGAGQVRADGAGQVLAAGDRCVEDTDFMRRNHMTLLMHQRDGTVNDGIRTRKHSLRGCLGCHAPAVPPDGAQPASIESGEHFCAKCHVFTAVRIDCFECHAELGETP